MSISRILSFRRCFALLLLLLLLLLIPSLFVHGSRLSAEDRRLLGAAEGDNTALPESSCKTNKFTMWRDGNVASSSSSSSSSVSSSSIEDSDRLVPTGPNPLHHRHH